MSNKRPNHHITYPNHHIKPLNDETGRIVDKGLTKREHFALSILCSDNTLHPTSAVKLADELIEKLNNNG